MSPFSLHEQSLHQKELTRQIFETNLIATEDSRLVALEICARERRRHRNDLARASQREEELKQNLDDSISKMEKLKEQSLTLTREKEATIEEGVRLRDELKEKDSLNKGLMDRLVQEANSHKETILQHEVSSRSSLPLDSSFHSEMKKLASTVSLSSTRRRRKQDQTNSLTSFASKPTSSLLKFYHCKQRINHSKRSSMISALRKTNCRFFITLPSLLDFSVSLSLRLSSINKPPTIRLSAPAMVKWRTRVAFSK
jgi:hypothetical protein